MVGFGWRQCGWFRVEWLHLVESRRDNGWTDGGLSGQDILQEDASAGWGSPSYKLTVSHSHANLVKL